MKKRLVSKKTIDNFFNNSQGKKNSIDNQKSFSNNKPVVSSPDLYNPLEEKHLVGCKKCGELFDITEYMKENLNVQRQNDIREFERFLIENDWFYRCLDYSKDCSQCEFWRDFDRKFKPRRKTTSRRIKR